MSFSSDQLLLMIIVGLMTWMLKETLKHGRKLASIDQWLRDLPCSKGICKIKEETEKRED